MRDSGRVPYPDLINIDSEEPITETDWFKWLKNDTTNTDRFHEALLMYLPGFDIEKHTIPQVQLDRHRHIFQHFYWLKFNFPETVSHE